MTTAEAARYAHIRRAADTLTALADLLQRTSGKYTRRAEWAELEVLEALEYAFDIDLTAERDVVEYSLGIDDEGYLRNDAGDPTFRVHVPLASLTGAV